MDLILYALIGVGAGVTSGIFGIGGGVIIVPALTFLMRFDAKTSAAMSLIALIPPVGLAAVINYYQGGVLKPANIWGGAFIAAGLVAGAYLGSKLALGLPDHVVRKAFAVFLAALAVYMYFKK